MKRKKWRAPIRSDCETEDSKSRPPSSSKVSLVPRPTPFFVLRFAFSIIHGSRRAVFAPFCFRVLHVYWTQTKEQKMGEAWESKVWTDYSGNINQRREIQALFCWNRKCRHRKLRNFSVDLQQNGSHDMEWKRQAPFNSTCQKQINLLWCLILHIPTVYNIGTRNELWICYVHSTPNEVVGVQQSLADCALIGLKRLITDSDIDTRKFQIKLTGDWKPIAIEVSMMWTLL